MPFFEVITASGSTSIIQARTKQAIRAALPGVALTSITKRKRCVQCKRVVATVRNTLCEPCWQEALTTCREAWQDIPMSEQALQDLAMSFFVAY